MFTHTKSDYRRHGSSVLNPAFWIISNYRFGKWIWTLKFAPFRWLLSKVYGLISLFLLLTTGDILGRETKIGKNYHIIHSGGTKINPHAIIGDNVGIMHGVTLGSNMDRPGAPIIGDNVYIGTGAVVIGKITIGDNSRISANSLVVSDVPPNTTAIGVPARIIKYTGRTYSKHEKSNKTSKSEDLERQV